MENRSKNPFSITKAVNFSDEEINIFWVELFQKRNELLNPFDPKPKYILGSKGCGKTHLLRYFSFNSRTFFHGGMMNAIVNDNFIGVYHLLGGLNSYRFSGKEISVDLWKELFQFYMELYITQNFLSIIEQLIVENEVEKEIEENACFEISKIFNSSQNISFKTIKELREIFSKIQNTIDYEVNNCVFNKKIQNIEIISNPGRILFEIPEIIVSRFNFLHNIKVVFLLDELEKLFDYQKKFINTLVWECKDPVRLWVGARYYGFKIKTTYNNEELKEGSEYELLSLDDIHRSNLTDYPRTCKDLIIHRLVKTQYINNEIPREELKDYFEEIPEAKILELIINQFGNTNYPHEKELRANLENYAVNGSLEIKIEDINTIISNLSYKSNPLYEKFNYFLFYQDWFKKNDLIRSSIEIKESLLFYISDKSKITKHNKVNDKFKQDLLAQLLKETNNSKFLYQGLDSIIEMSWGNPRNLLTILKLIYKWSFHDNIKPFITDKISIDEQNKGILEGAKWFYNDADLTDNEGLHAYKIINQLGTVLQAERFSNKPIECSPSSVYVNLSELSEDSCKYINIIKDHSFIVEIDDGRKDRNLPFRATSFQIHRMLSPLWFLPIYRRGTVYLNSGLAEAIFNPTEHKYFKIHLQKFSKKRNVPFSDINEDNIYQKALF